MTNQEWNKLRLAIARCLDQLDEVIPKFCDDANTEYTDKFKNGLKTVHEVIKKVL